MQILGRGTEEKNRAIEIELLLAGVIVGCQICLTQKILSPPRQVKKWKINDV